MRSSDSHASCYVQYGAGLCAPGTWRNFDASPTLRFERLPILGALYTANSRRFPSNVEYGDIVKGLPVRKGSVRAAYASHVLEHLALDDLRSALRHTFEMLAPKGLFRLVVPDLEVLARRYVAAKDTSAASDFVRDLGMGAEQRPRTPLGILRSLVGNSAHRWMWDCKGLSAELNRAGFVEIRRCTFGDSAEPRIADVEDEERLRDAVALECRRPR